MITSPLGKKIYEANELPWLPRGSRIMIKPDKPDEQTECGLVIPGEAQKRGMMGMIVAAGLGARDQMHDQGDEVGDRICFGQFAGIWEEWDHITEPGSDAKCAHAAWDRVPCRLDRTNAFACSACGAKRFQEPLLIMDVDDIKGNEDAARRLDRGEISIRHGVTTGGRTQFHLARKDETNGTLHGSNTRDRDADYRIGDADIAGDDKFRALAARGARAGRNSGPEAA